MTLRPGRLADLASISVGLLLIAVVLGSAASTFWSGDRIRPDDFMEYWASARLNLQGQDPYDEAAVFDEQRRIGTSSDVPVMMYNPPWVFAITMPFALLEFPIARALWFLLEIVGFIVCADLLWKLYGGAARLDWIPRALVVTSFSCFITVVLGQISLLPLAGAVGFLYFERRRRDGWAGASLALAAVKPHLVYLVWPAMLLWVIRERRWRILAGAAGALAAATLVAVGPNPAVLAHYRDLMTIDPPAQYFSPTIGGYLRVNFGVGELWPQFVPAALGLAWLLFYWNAKGGSWRWLDRLPALLFASTLTAAYGAWAADLVILLVPIVQTAVLVAGRRRRAALWSGAVLHVVINAAAMTMSVNSVQEHLYIWMTPAILIGCYGLTQWSGAVKNGPATAGSATPGA